jgi:cytochrome c556
MPGEKVERLMQKATLVLCVSTGLLGFVAVAVSAENLAEAVKERRHLMKEVVRPAAKLGGDMTKGKIPFDAAKAAKAMTEISEVPDKYVTLFPKGTEHGAIADSEASPKIWEDFDGFKEVAHKLKEATAQAATEATKGEGAFATAFNAMTKVCKECHQTYRVEEE